MVEETRELNNKMNCVCLCVCCTCSLEVTEVHYTLTPINKIAHVGVRMLRSARLDGFPDNVCFASAEAKGTFY